MNDIIIDPATGLPQLPEGYFWRVEKAMPGSQYGYVRLMRRRKAWVPKVEASRIFTLTELTESELFSDAVQVYSDFDFEGTARYRTLLGDYPPKTINASTEIDGDN
jgi:hypothetical protein